VITIAENITVPMLLPRRGKGHSEITATFKVLTTTDVQPLDLLQPLSSFYRTTLLKDTLSELAHKIVRQNRLDSVVVDASFGYVLDRVSASFIPTVYSYPCNYRLSSDAKAAEHFDMTIKLPFLIFDEQKQLMANELEVTLINPANKVFLEDIIDRVQQLCKVKFYPASSTQDEKENIRRVRSEKALPEVLYKFTSSVTDSKWAKSVTVVVSYRDIYNNFILRTVF